MSHQSDMIEAAPPAYVDQHATQIDQAPKLDTKGDETPEELGIPPDYSPTSNVTGEELLELVLDDVNGRASIDESPFYVPPSARRNPGSKVLQEKISAELELLSFQRLHYQRPSNTSSLADQMITAFFFAISRGSTELVERILDSDLLDANTPAIGDDAGLTPLLCAIQKGQIHLVSLLISRGALVDAYGVYRCKDGEGTCQFRHIVRRQVAEGVVRTPLHLAASIGNLPIVKALIEQFSADDALIAPDGQIALRLAAENGHTEVAAYLPVRRGGGYLRWKTKHHKFVKRMKKGAQKLGAVVKFSFYTVPKAVFYQFPKWIVSEMASSVRKSVIYVWQNKHKIIPWCKDLLKSCWEAVLETPRVVKEILVGLKNLVVRIVTVHIPRIVTVYIPTLVKAIVKAIKATGGALWSAIKWVSNRAMSFLHTLFEAIVSAFRHLTWKNIAAGFVDLLHAIFVDLPQLLIKGVKKAGSILEVAMKGVFGCVYYVAKFFVCCFYDGCAYILKQVWRILSGIGGTTAEAGKEIRVWFNPKA